jgi:hypothetical protein
MTRAIRNVTSSSPNIVITMVESSRPRSLVQRRDRCPIESPIASGAVAIVSVLIAVSSARSPGKVQRERQSSVLGDIVIEVAVNPDDQTANVFRRGSNFDLLEHHHERRHFLVLAL